MGAIEPCFNWKAILSVALGQVSTVTSKWRWFAWTCTPSLLLLHPRNPAHHLQSGVCLKIRGICMEESGLQSAGPGRTGGRGRKCYGPQLCPPAPFLLNYHPTRKSISHTFCWLTHMTAAPHEPYPAQWWVKSLVFRSLSGSGLDIHSDQFPVLCSWMCSLIQPWRLRSVMAAAPRTTAWL